MVDDRRLERPSGERGAGPGARLPVHHRDPPPRLLGAGHHDDPCGNCGRSGVQSVDVALANGDQARMQSCSRCEVRTWWHNGSQVTLVHMLSMVRETGVSQAPRAKRKR